MAFSRTDVMFLATMFIIQEHASARLFTAECTKNTGGQFLCATNDADTKVDPQQGMTGHVGCPMSCTLDERCLHFNVRFLSADRGVVKCYLFYSEPISFDVEDGCEHYHAERLTIPAGALELTSFHKFTLCRGRRCGTHARPLIFLRFFV